MKRAILTEELLKNELQITHSGCRSSFATIISHGLTSKRERRAAEIAESTKQLDRAKAMKERDDAYILTVQLERERMLRASSTFQSVSSAAPIGLADDNVTLQRSYVDNLYEETRRYRQEIEELRHQLQYAEASRQQLLDLHVDNRMREPSTPQFLPQAAPPPERNGREELIHILNNINILDNPRQTNEDTIDETTSKV